MQKIHAGCWENSRKACNYNHFFFFKDWYWSAVIGTSTESSTDFTHCREYFVWLSALIVAVCAYSLNKYIHNESKDTARPQREQFEVR